VLAAAIVGYARSPQRVLSGALSSVLGEVRRAAVAPGLNTGPVIRRSRHVEPSTARERSPQAQASRRRCAAH
jgi:hypothetical protein